MRELFEGLIRLDVLVEAQDILGVVFFLDFRQARIILPVYAPDKLGARFA